MVSTDPEGRQGECRRSQEIVHREKSTREAWFLLGNGDEHCRCRARYICVGS
jgi:hypothetical protein